MTTTLDRSGALTSEIELMEKLNAEVFDPPEYAGLKRAVQDQLDSVAVRKNEASPWSGSNRQQAKAILVTGASRAGKSFSVTQALADLEPTTTVDGHTIRPKPIFVECSSVFEIGALGSQILPKIGYPATREFSPAVAWNRVRTHLPHGRPAPLVIDEYQYSFHPDRVSPKRLDEARAKIQGVFRSLLDVPDWPTPLILIGTTSVVEMLESPGLAHVREKIRDIVCIEPVTRSADNVAQIQEALDTYCGHAVLDYDLDPDTILRIIHACSAARGLILDFLKDVVVSASRDENRRLVAKHFADTYRSKTGAHDSANPFVAIQWDNTHPHLLLESVNGIPRDTPKPNKSRK